MPLIVPVGAAVMSLMLNVVLGARPVVAAFREHAGPNTNVIKPEAGTFAGALVESRGGPLPLPPGNICPFYG
jgi:hypothetical protein